MSDRPKKKSQPGNRNDARPNGKAYKQNPKASAPRTPEQEAKALARKAERAAKVQKEQDAKRAIMNRLHERALRDHAVWEADRRRKVARDAMGKMKPVIK